MPSPELELRSRIERRLRRFVLEKRVSNPKLVDLIGNVAAASESCAVFGGVPRRHVRGDHLDENFDIDIVVQAEERDVIEHLVEGTSPRKTRFGGWRFDVEGDAVDLWFVEDTWAFRKHQVEFSEFRDVLRTTFFSWDALLFDLKTLQLVAEDRVLAELREGILDVNLDGVLSDAHALIGTYRRVVFDHARLTSRLQAAVLRVYARCDIQEIASLCSAQQSVHLSFSQLSEFMSDLKLHYKASPDAHFSVKLANG